MTQVYPVGGGKGGIGKSMVAASFGTILARQGKKVLLMDLDLGASNLHSFLGVTDTAKGLDSYLAKQVDTLQAAAVPTEVDNLFLISSKNCGTEAANLYTAQKHKIIRNMGQLDYDYLILDLGGGTHFNLLDFFLSANQGICVLTSEPTAIENTFNFIKAVYFRMVKQLMKTPEFSSLSSSVDLSGKAAVNSIEQSFGLIDTMVQQNPEMGQALKKELGRYTFHFVVNQVRPKDDPDLGRKIETVCRRHFHAGFKFAGTIRHDDAVRDAVQLRKNFITAYAHTRAANDMARIARKMLDP